MDPRIPASHALQGNAGGREDDILDLYMVKKMKLVILILPVALLVFTRFYGLNWGFPYAFHPDENNMTGSLLQLSCSSSNLLECFNPRFFAYGQLQLFLAGFIFNFVSRFVVPYSEFLVGTMSLRLVSAIASIITGLVLTKMIFGKTSSFMLTTLFLILYTFTPGFIQQAHFGTTESLLTLFLVLIVYFDKRELLQALLIGLATATKPSGILFAVIPLYHLFRFSLGKRVLPIRRIIKIVVIVLAVTLLFSPHYLLHFRDFWQTFAYESALARGSIEVFYTEQFRSTIPVVFQLTKVFPYALGVPVTLIALFGLLQSIPLLSLFLYFSFLYVKWARFIVPITVLILYFGFIGLHKKRNITVITVLTFIIVLYQIVFGIRFMALYSQKDVRVTASEWINKNVPPKSRILTESANVYGLPLENLNQFKVTHLFLYDMTQLPDFNSFDYVIIPSRRVFKNYYQKSRNKVIDTYYDTVFDAKKFKLVKQFSVLDPLDEEAEETWSVFDHPTVRIYKRLASSY